MGIKLYGTKELRQLQRKYINEDGTKKRGILAKGQDANKHISLDEFFEIKNVFILEPRIGRLGNDRKKANELVAIPRGLLEVLLDEMGFLICYKEHFEEISGGIGEVN